ncbi:hypothetical protein BJV78DRAFT_1240809 [Lactifluus subvellereus]|nr:hypothetical protein BJV78DRAFT_1240809 [Lactifluus subvellereus]
MQVSTRSPTDQRIADAVRVAPYLTHVIRQQGQLALMPQDNSSHSRKPKREKRPRQERQQRTHEEPHFNVGAPRTPRRGQPGSPGGRPRTSRRPDVSDAGSIPDYPPPSFDEAIAAAAGARTAAPPLSPADSTTTNSSSPDRYQAAPILIPPVPRSQNQPVVTRTPPDPSSTESVRYSTQAEYDSDSDDGDLEVISTSEATPSTGAWEQDHLKRPAREKIQPDFVAAWASARAVRPSPSQLTLTQHPSETSQDGGDDPSASSPSTDSQADDLVVGTWDSTPSSIPPKRRLHLLSGLLKSRDNHPASAPSTPTHAAASQLSLPLPFLNRPGSPSKPHRGESLISRKLFGHKGKDKYVDVEVERPSEPLETWEMLSDIERDFSTPSGSGYPRSPTSSVPEHFPSTHGPSDSPLRLSPGRRREGARPKHYSMLNHPVLPPPLPLTPTTPEHTANSSAQTELRERDVPTSVQRQLPAPVSHTSSTNPAVPLLPSPSQGLPAQSMKPLLGPQTVTDNPTRGRVLRTTSSMVWTPSRRFSPVPSPTRSATTPTSPATSLQSAVTDIDYDPGTSAAPAAHDGQEGSILIALPPSPVQEEEEEQFVTPPGSPVRSPATLLLPTLSSRHASPVRHEGRVGVTLCDDGPVPPGSPTRSEAHARVARTPTITPRPSIGALRAFAPPNSSPLANRPFEGPATVPPITSLTVEDMVPPSRDTVVSVGDTESLIELYVHSPGPTPAIPAASSSVTLRPTDSDDFSPVSITDPKQYHYPGRPLPHPPGASQSDPVRPVLLDLFLAGSNAPTGLPPYAKVESEKQRSAHHLSSQHPKQVSRAAGLPPSPLVNQPGGCRPPVPLPGLLSVLDDDPSEPSSPGSTYEVSPSTPSAIQREFTSLETFSAQNDEDRNPSATGSTRENTLLRRGVTNSTRKGSKMTTPVVDAQYSVNGAQLGRIEVVRRRITRNGRVKLKMVLLGATVDRCAICTTQFKDHESAAVGTRCQHAFHERCASSWFARGNRTCPRCLTPFD